MNSLTTSSSISTTTTSLNNHNDNKIADIIVLVGPSGCGKTSVVRQLERRHPHMFTFCTSHTTRPPREGEVDRVHYYFVSREKFLELVKQDMMLEYTLLFPSSSTSTTPATSNTVAAAASSSSNNNGTTSSSFLEQLFNVKYNDIQGVLDLEKKHQQQLSSSSSSFGGTFYGTSKKALKKSLKRNKCVLMDTDLKGALSLHHFFRANHDNNNGNDENNENDVGTKQEKEQDIFFKKFNLKIILIMPPSLSEVRRRLVRRRSEDNNSLNARMAYNASWVKYYKTYQHIFDFTIVNDDLEECVTGIERFINVPSLLQRQQRHPLSAIPLIQHNSSSASEEEEEEKNMENSTDDNSVDDTEGMKNTSSDSHKNFLRKSSL